MPDPEPLDSQDRRIPGVAVATVVDNVDLTGQCRVQLSLAWLPDTAPWARVSTMLAGPDTGTFFIPQPGDEVLVAFHQGDTGDPYVVGSLWNGGDTPPAENQWDAQRRFRIRTPLGHDLLFDDGDQSVTLTTISGHTVTVDPNGVRLATAKDTAALSLGAKGDVAITAKGRLTIDAQEITLSAPKIELSAKSEVAVNGGRHCGIKAAMIDIN